MAGKGCKNPKAPKVSSHKPSKFLKNQEKECLRKTKCDIDEESSDEEGIPSHEDEIYFESFRVKTRSLIANISSYIATMEINIFHNWSCIAPEPQDIFGMLEGAEKLSCFLEEKFYAMEDNEAMQLEVENIKYAYCRSKIVIYIIKNILQKFGGIDNNLTYERIVIREVNKYLHLIKRFGLKLPMDCSILKVDKNKVSFSDFAVMIEADLGLFSLKEIERVKGILKKPAGEVCKANFLLSLKEGDSLKSYETQFFQETKLSEETQNSGCGALNIQEKSTKRKLRATTSTSSSKKLNIGNNPDVSSLSSEIISFPGTSLPIPTKSDRNLEKKKRSYVKKPKATTSTSSSKKLNIGNNPDVSSLSSEIISFPGTSLPIPTKSDRNLEKKKRSYVKKPKGESKQLLYIARDKPETLNRQLPLLIEDYLPEYTANNLSEDSQNILPIPSVNNLSEDPENKILKDSEIKSPEDLKSNVIEDSENYLPEYCKNSATEDSENNLSEYCKDNVTKIFENYGKNNLTEGFNLMKDSEIKSPEDCKSNVTGDSKNYLPEDCKNSATEDSENNLPEYFKDNVTKNFENDGKNNLTEGFNLVKDSENKLFENTGYKATTSTSSSKKLNIGNNPDVSSLSSEIISFPGTSLPIPTKSDRNLEKKKRSYVKKPKATTSTSSSKKLNIGNNPDVSSLSSEIISFPGTSLPIPTKSDRNLEKKKRSYVKKPKGESKQLLYIARDKPETLNRQLPLLIEDYLPEYTANNLSEDSQNILPIPSVNNLSEDPENKILKDSEIKSPEDLKSNVIEDSENYLPEYCKNSATEDSENNLSEYCKDNVTKIFENYGKNNLTEGFNLMKDSEIKSPEDCKSNVTGDSKNYLPEDCKNSATEDSENNLPEYFKDNVTKNFENDGKNNLTEGFNLVKDSENKLFENTGYKEKEETSSKGIAEISVPVLKKVIQNGEKKESISEHTFNKVLVPVEYDVTKEEIQCGGSSLLISANLDNNVETKKTPYNKNQKGTPIRANLDNNVEKKKRPYNKKQKVDVCNKLKPDLKIVKKRKRRINIQNERFKGSFLSDQSLESEQGVKDKTEINISKVPAVSNNEEIARKIDFDLCNKLQVKGSMNFKKYKKSDIIIPATKTLKDYFKMDQESLNNEENLTNITENNDVILKEDKVSILPYNDLPVESKINHVVQQFVLGSETKIVHLEKGINPEFVEKSGIDCNDKIINISKNLEETVETEKTSHFQNFTAGTLEKIVKVIDDPSCGGNDLKKTLSAIINQRKGSEEEYFHSSENSLLYKHNYIKASSIDNEFDSNPGYNCKADLYNNILNKANSSPLENIPFNICPTNENINYGNSCSYQAADSLVTNNKVNSNAVETKSEELMNTEQFLQNSVDINYSQNVMPSEISENDLNSVSLAKITKRQHFKGNKISNGKSLDVDFSDLYWT